MTNLSGPHLWVLCRIRVWLGQFSHRPADKREISGDREKKNPVLWIQTLKPCFELSYRLNFLHSIYSIPWKPKTRPLNSSNPLKIRIKKWRKIILQINCHSFLEILPDSNWAAQVVSSAHCTEDISCRSRPPHHIANTPYKATEAFCHQISRSSSRHAKKKKGNMTVVLGGWSFERNPKVRSLSLL